MDVVRRTDDSWLRLLCAGPAATVVALAALLGFLRLTLEQPPLPVLPKPVVVSVLALPPPAPVPPAVVSPSEPPPAAVSPPKPPPVPVKPTEVAPPKPELTPPPEPKPVKLRKPKLRPKKLKPPEPKPEPTPQADNPPPRSRPPQPAPAPKSPPSLAATPQPSQSREPSGGDIGARAIYKPMPEIPDELRRQNLSLVAVARFHVGADGTDAVELIAATPLVQLNQALLDSLKKWRFFPALKDGKPVASVIDIRIPITVQ